MPFDPTFPRAAGTSPASSRLAGRAAAPASAARRAPSRSHVAIPLASPPLRTNPPRVRPEELRAGGAAVAGFEPLLDETQTARLLQVSIRTLQGWRLKGGGPPFIRLGRLIRYRRCDLVEYVEQQIRASTSDPGPGAR